MATIEVNAMTHKRDTPHDASQSYSYLHIGFYSPSTIYHGRRTCTQRFILHILNSPEKKRLHDTTNPITHAT